MDKNLHQFDNIPSEFGQISDFESEVSSDHDSRAASEWFKQSTFAPNMKEGKLWCIIYRNVRF